MKELTRTEVDQFNINDSYTLEELEENKENVKIISIEEVLKENISITLNKEKLTLFLNGGRINIGKIDVGVGALGDPQKIAKIYNSQNQFIGTGTVVNNILKRDIII